MANMIRHTARAVMNKVATMKMGRQLVLRVLVWLIVFIVLIGGYTVASIHMYKGTPLLCRAVERDDFAEVQRLIELGVSPSHAEHSGEDHSAPLDIAIRRKNFPIVRYLVEHGAGRYNPRTGDDRLKVAAAIGSPEILAYLMQCYPDHDKAQLLYYAAGANDSSSIGSGCRIDNVKYLLAHGAQPGINKSFIGGERAIHVARTAEIATYLLSHGAQLSVEDNLGHTPLSFAAARENLEMVKFYVELGLDVNAKNKAGESMQKETGSPRIAKYLKAHGAK